MRYKAGHGEQTRQRIVEEAARAFRGGGAGGVSIGDVMARLGITHGGFYAHFESKEALLAAACTQALKETQAKLVGLAEQDGFPAMIQMYLSGEHRDNPADGCLLPALAGEIAREGMAVRYAFTRSLEQLMEGLVPMVPGGTAEERRQRVTAIMTSMAGSVLLARAVCDPLLSERILAASRHLCTSLLETPSPPRTRRVTPTAPQE